MTKNALAPAVVTPMEELFGKTLLTHASGHMSETNKVFKHKQLVALFFAAKYDKPSVEVITPKLIELYNSQSPRARDKLEIVYVSSDTKRTDFEEFYGQMPWLSIAEDSDKVVIQKTALAQTLSIKNVPALVVLEVATGNLVAYDGLEQLHRYSGDYKNLLKQWKSTTPIELEEGVRQSLQKEFTAKGFFKLFVRQSIAIFFFVLLFLFVRNLLRMYLIYTNKAPATFKAGIAEEPVPEL
jgi:hypothetical protein